MSRDINVSVISEAVRQKQVQSVAQRIDSRCRLLQRWLAEGVPIGQWVPQSLTEARLWDDPMLGIMRIASPNEFTQKHVIHGSRVKQIASLLTKIRKKYGMEKGLRGSSKERAAVPDASFNRAEVDRQLVAAVSQWHAERAAHLHEKSRAQAAEARERNYLAESDMKDRVISELRRELAGRRGLRVMK